MDEAIARFRKATELTPNDSAMHLDLGIALHNRRKLPETIESFRVFAGHTADVHGIAFPRDGKRLLSSGLDNTARLWDIESGKEVYRIQAPNGVTCAAFTDDDRQAVFSCYDKTLHLWAIPK